MAVGTMSREDRAVLARAALARAEQRTGARSVLARVGPVTGCGAPDRSRTARAHPGSPARAAPVRRWWCCRTRRRRPSSSRAPGSSPASARRWRSRRRWSRSCPKGCAAAAPRWSPGRRRWCWPCSRTRAPQGRGRASSASRPSACSRRPRRGSSLDRLAVVPRPGLEAATVVAALLDGVDVVVVGPQAALTDTERRKLSARARDRGSVLLSTVDWPGAGVVLTVESGRWTGIDAGAGATAHARDPAGPHRPGQCRGAALARPDPAHRLCAGARAAAAAGAGAGTGLRLVG